MTRQFLYALCITLFTVSAAMGSDGLGAKLIDATEAGNLSKIEELLEQGANVNATSKGMQTPLMFAATEDHMEAAKLLLGKGANPLQDR
ncbi:hypothetical protein BOW35_03135 [Solemya velum gill symbiont]|uniref:ankyrin repeat domain-containing protein n=1 Tax=Solemya velum gill symbiont TaxID=2340 RepID=UPI000996C330|nr:ankyrin repeat domain-containing protein [Solemya velum gill symbiont]OOZ15829.1 hypothetical protein BOW27_02620 [Solemya velum gill symbiont]OOZ20807.1 hypothetical protein BOW29_00190 [Solemya velum gill symbiont]OOZ23648.1 hypothetical protein BOW30_01135 [Solemya velum gill symbiont]OOZ25190.1 hypothetical protein BOW31_02565 [Solemya velum gill symbiont]OOZ30442.1 hypothetical protein BOW33_01135 [Solemya velum gill symbiont]